jgi:hypothetical protein
VNGDGLNDLFIGGSRFHKGKFLIQTTSGSFTEKIYYLAWMEIPNGGGHGYAAL